MNFADSQEIYREFAKYDFSLTDNISKADAILVNTCTVREHAEHRALSYIGTLNKWKKQKTGRLLTVAGCVAQRLGAELKKRFPYIDIVSGAKEISDFAEVLKNKLGERQIIKCPHGEKTQVSAFVTIMRGCSHNCSYCIVPYVRGSAKFYPPDKILKETENYCNKGASQIFLLGQTVNAYKYDKMDFGGLLCKISEIKKVKRIRYLSPHPLYINQKFTETIANYPKIARHIHIPLQTGSDRLLKLTRRGYTRKKIVTLIESLKRIQNFSVSTDLMVGLPTETEKDFNQTLSLVKECGFSYAYCFKYSARKQTTLAKYEQNTPQFIIEERLNKLLDLVKKTAQVEFSKQPGTTQEILLETPTEGKTSSDWRVKIYPEQNHRPGDILKVKITDSYNRVLRGQPI